VNFATFLATHQWIIILAAAWTIPWKGVALWRAARNQSIAWFVILLIVNTFGILEIIYIFAFSKKTEIEVATEEKAEMLQPVETTAAPQPVEIPEAPSPEEKTPDIKAEKKSDLDDSVQKS